MGGASNKPEYTGIDKYPGWISTVITIVVAVVFVGALIMEGSHGHGEGHGEGHGDAHHDEAQGEGHHDDAAHEEAAH
jgi:hypothetical protein